MKIILKIEYKHLKILPILFQNSKMVIIFTHSLFIIYQSVVSKNLLNTYSFLGTILEAINTKAFRCTIFIYKAYRLESPKQESKNVINIYL